MPGGATILSPCARWRICVIPGDEGTLLEVWSRGSFIDTKRGPRTYMWRLEETVILQLPYHAALDRAHDLIMRGLKDE